MRGCLFFIAVLLLLTRGPVSGQPAATVVIGNQEWMAQNLSIDHYQDGTVIPEARTKAEWVSYNERKMGCYCKYDNEGHYEAMYGKLYNWYAIKRGLAPHCWRLPNKNDFDRLVAYLGTDSASKKLKSAHSWSNDWNGVNTSRFGGLAAGCRNANGTFGYVGRKAFWWTNDARKQGSGKETGLVFSVDNDDKCNYDISEDFGFSVRCVRQAGGAPPMPCP